MDPLQRRLILSSMKDIAVGIAWTIGILVVFFTIIIGLVALGELLGGRIILLLTTIVGLALTFLLRYNNLKSKDTAEKRNIVTILS